MEEYLAYYNQKRIKLGLRGLSSVQYRAQYLS
ncbi:IS3 family transposase [uncultured Haemophilus sp.]